MSTESVSVAQVAGATLSPDDPMYISTTYKTVGGIFSVRDKVGFGASGEIYSGVNMNNDRKVALKFELKLADTVPLLLYEYKLYKQLGASDFIPRVYYFGNEVSHFVLVMDLLGPSLEDLFNMSSRLFSLRTVALLAVQMISCCEYIHENDYVHRDIKPDNFLIKNFENETKVLIVDFGLSKRFRNRSSHEHIEMKEGKPLIGTVRYASINNHLGYEQSRRDDLESIGYIMIYFLKGVLPWQGIKCDSKLERYSKIKDVKLSLTTEQLCTDCPAEFVLYLNYCKNLGFTEVPDYNYLKKLFVGLYENRQKRSNSVSQKPGEKIETDPVEKKTVDAAEKVSGEKVKENQVETVDNASPKEVEKVEPAVPVLVVSTPEVKPPLEAIISAEAEAKPFVPPMINVSAKGSGDKWNAGVSPISVNIPFTPAAMMSPTNALSPVYGSIRYTDKNGAAMTPAYKPHQSGKRMFSFDIKTSSTSGQFLTVSHTAATTGQPLFAANTTNYARDSIASYKSSFDPIPLTQFNAAESVAEEPETEEVEEVPVDSKNTTKGSNADKVDPPKSFCGCFSS